MTSNIFQRNKIIYTNIRNTLLNTLRKKKNLNILNTLFGILLTSEDEYIYIHIYEVINNKYKYIISIYFSPGAGTLMINLDWGTTILSGVR